MVFARILEAKSVLVIDKYVPAGPGAVQVTRTVVTGSAKPQLAIARGKHRTKSEIS